MELFDANCMLGPAPARQPGAPTTAEGLQVELRRVGIGRALVYSSLAEHYSPAEGNARLLATVRDYPELIPCWVLMPLTTQELPGAGSGATLVDQMLAQGVKAARMFPTLHRFSVRGWLLGDLLYALAARRVPLILDFGNRSWGDRFTDWEAVRETCLTHPHLPVILVREGMASDRWLYPLFHQCPNLFIEMSYYQVHRGIEVVCRRFGPGRLLFGTGMPIYDPGAPISMLLYSDVADDARRQIGSGNLERLLAEVR